MHILNLTVPYRIVPYHTVPYRTAPQRLALAVAAGWQLAAAAAGSGAAGRARKSSGSKFFREKKVVQKANARNTLTSSLVSRSRMIIFCEIYVTELQDEKNMFARAAVGSAIIHQAIARHYEKRREL